MPLATDRFIIDGFQGEPALYNFELRDVSYDFSRGEVTLEVWGAPEDESPSAFVDEATITVSVDGSERYSEPGYSYSSSRGSDNRVTVEAGPDSSVEVSITAPAWTDLDGGVPEAVLSATLNEQPPVSESDVSVSCSLDDGEVTVGEETTVTATVANENAVEVDADVTIEAGGTEATETLRVPADGTATVDVTFAFDEPGEYAPDVSVSL